MTYTRNTPPFNFLGTMNRSQHQAFATWISGAEQQLPAVTAFHQMRAQQLRKAAGLMEKFYAQDPRGLAPTFVKERWTSLADGHIFPGAKDDHMPANTMIKVKARFQPVLARDEEAVFRMNWLRTRIEAAEDAAQYAAEAAADDATDMQELQGYFADPYYQSILVDDQGDLYEGQPRFRVHPLDPPTPWEQLMISQVIPNS